MNHHIPTWMEREVAEYDLEISPMPRTVLDIGANIGAFALRAHRQWPKATNLFDMIPEIQENSLNSGQNHGTSGSKTNLAGGA